MSFADFVVYLGDVITANNIPIKNASLYWNQALSPTRARNTPWASVFGNHDDASFEWPLEWFSATGIPPVNCSANFFGEFSTVMDKLSPAACITTFAHKELF